MRGGRWFVTIGAATLTVACASSQGTEPEAMSARAHDAMAAGHEAEANQVVAVASRASDVCRTASGQIVEDPVCWTSVVQSNEAQLREAERHRRAAAEHRAASQALRDAEARACVGIDEADRDMSPFAHREDIREVHPLRVNEMVGRQPVERLVGATVVFRAITGLTAEWLQHEIDCHRARAASLGFDMPEMTYCPLTLRGVSARVASTGDGFAVDLRSNDPSVAHEIVRRAEQLVAPSR